MSLIVKENCLNFLQLEVSLLCTSVCQDIACARCIKYTIIITMLNVIPYYNYMHIYIVYTVYIPGYHSLDLRRHTLSIAVSFPNSIL